MLSDDDIRNMLQGVRRKINYRHELELYLGHKLTDDELIQHKVFTVAQIRRMKPRADRLAAIMIRRYNVPQALVSAYDEELHSNYSDW